MKNALPEKFEAQLCAIDSSHIGLICIQSRASFDSVHDTGRSTLASEPLYCTCLIKANSHRALKRDIQE